MKKYSFFQILLIITFSLIPYGNATSQEIKWEKSFGSKFPEYLTDVIPTADNGFLLGGSSYSNISDGQVSHELSDLNYFIWKIDENGKEEWQKTYGGKGKDLLSVIRLTSDGGYILGGQSVSGIGGDKDSPCLGGDDIWVLKLNAAGVIQWQVTLGGEGKDILDCILPTSDGGFLLGASSSSTVLSDSQLETQHNHLKIIRKKTVGLGNMDFWVVKVDKRGELEWQHSYGGKHSDVLKDAIAMEDGGFLLGGISNSPEAMVGSFSKSSPKTEKCYGMYDYWIIRIDKQGEVIWEKVYGGSNDDFFNNMTKTSDGTILLGGSSFSGTEGNKNISNKKGSDLWLVEINEQGEILKQFTYNIGKSDQLQSMLLSSDGFIYLGGYAKSETVGTRKTDKEGINDYVMIKCKTDGEEIDRKIVGSVGEDVLQKIVETRDGGYLLCGTSRGEASRDRKNSKGSNDFWIVKLVDPEKPKTEVQLLEAIPNPAMEFTNIVVGFDFEDALLTIYDLGGRSLRSFSVDQRIIPLSLQGLPTGIFIVEVKNKENKASVKVIKKQN